MFDHLVRVPLQELTPGFVAASGSRELTKLIKVALSNKDDSVILLKDEYQLMQSRYQKKLRTDQDFDRIAGKRVTALELETQGDIAGAIALYEECIFIGECEENHLGIYHFSYEVERLLYLYKKTKQQQKELHLLRECVGKYPTYKYIHKWKDRLDKFADHLS